ncbi:hypothetical protein D3C77_783870 [compost metagenome]
MPGRLALENLTAGLAQDVQAHQQQVGGDERLEYRAIELGDQQGAEEGAEHAG